MKFMGVILKLAKFVNAVFDKYMQFFPPPTEGDFKWMVPISIATSSQPTKPIQKVVLEDQSISVTVDAAESEGIKVSVGVL